MSALKVFAVMFISNLVSAENSDIWDDVRILAQCVAFIAIAILWMLCLGRR